MFNIIRGSYFTILPILVHDQCYSMVEIRWQGLLLCLHNFSCLSFKVSTQHFSCLIFDMLEILLIPSLGFNILSITWVRFCFHISNLNKSLLWIPYQVFFCHLFSIPFMLFCLVFLVEPLVMTGCLHDSLQFSSSVARIHWLMTLDRDTWSHLLIYWE